MKKVLALGTLAWVATAEGAKRPAATLAVLMPFWITVFAALFTGVAWLFSGGVLPEYRPFLLGGLFLTVLVPGLVLNLLLVRYLRRVEFENAVAAQRRADAGHPDPTPAEQGLWGVVKDPLGAANDTVNAVRKAGKAN